MNRAVKDVKLESMFYDDIFLKLQDRGVKFIVVGGVAVALHGALRMTADLDLMVALDRKNVLKFTDLMTERGYKPKAPVQPAEFANPKRRDDWKKNKNMKVFSWYHPERPEELLDVFIDEPIPFADAYRRRVPIRAGKTLIPVISIPDLITLKEGTGRPQDRADIEALRCLVS